MRNGMTPRQTIQLVVSFKGIPFRFIPQHGPESGDWLRQEQVEVKEMQEDTFALRSAARGGGEEPW